MNATISETAKRDVAAQSQPTPEFVDAWAHEEYLSVWLRRQAQSYANLGSERGQLVAQLLTALANDALACETPGVVLDVPTFVARRASLEADRGWPDEPDTECDGYRWVPTEAV